MRRLLLFATTFTFCSVLLTPVVQAQKMYWTDKANSRIERANLDGSGRETPITELLTPRGITLDVTAGKMYWTQEVAYRIERANLDGSGQETLLTGADSPSSIALDVTGGKMYWITTDRIERANLDGSGRETLLAGLPLPRGIALDLSCTLGLEANYANGTLDLDFELGHTIPVLFSAGIRAQGFTIPYWFILLRPIDPPVSFSVPIENFPQVGEVVVWTTLISRGVRPL